MEIKKAAFSDSLKNIYIEISLIELQIQAQAPQFMHQYIE